MADKLRATQQELEDRVQAYWELTKGNTYRSSLPTEFSVTANNCAVIGSVAGISFGFTQQISNALNLASKHEDLPFFKNIKPMEQTRLQALSRIVLSGFKGSVVGGIFGATFLLLQFNPNGTFGTPDNSMFISGACAGTLCGALWRQRLMGCIGMGLFAGILARVSTSIHRNAQPPTLKALRATHYQQLYKANE